MRYAFSKENVYDTNIAILRLSRAGIDGGGVFKEFLTSLSKEVFDSDRGLWLSTKNELYPNPHVYATDRKPPGIFLCS